jgi:hypothetical protein
VAFWELSVIHLTKILTRGTIALEVKNMTTYPDIYNSLPFAVVPTQSTSIHSVTNPNTPLSNCLPELYNSWLKTSYDACYLSNISPTLAQNIYTYKKTDYEEALEELDRLFPTFPMELKVEKKKIDWLKVFQFIMKLFERRN